MERSSLQITEKQDQNERTSHAELDRHIAFSGYIIDGSTEKKLKIKLTEVIKSYKSHYNSAFLGKKYFEYCSCF